MSSNSAQTSALFNEWSGYRGGSAGQNCETHPQSRIHSRLGTKLVAIPVQRSDLPRQISVNFKG